MNDSQMWKVVDLVSLVCLPQSPLLRPVQELHTALELLNLHLRAWSDEHPTRSLRALASTPDTLLASPDTLLACDLCSGS